jgi:Zn-dependent protease with chaperone function
MSRWFLAWQRDASVNQTWEDIDSLFEFSDDVVQEGQRSRYRDESEGTIFSWRYEWIVAPGEGAIEVSEKAYVTPSWFFTTSFFLIGFLLSHVIGAQAESILNPILLAASLFFFILYVLTVLRVFEYNSPVRDFFRKQADQDVFHPYFSFILALLPPFFSMLWLNGVLQYVAATVIVALVFGYFIFQGQVERYSIRWQETFVRLAKQLPAIVVEYGRSLLMVSLPLWLYVILIEQSIFFILIDAFPYITAILYVLLALFLLKMASVGFVEGSSIGKTRFRRYGSEVSNRWVMRVSTAVTVLTALGFGYLSFRFLSRIRLLTSVASEIPGLLIISVSAVPVLILGFGFAYQIWSLLSGLFAIGWRVRRRDLAEDYQTEVNTYLLEYDGYYAGAVDLGWKEFIIVSKGLVKELSSEELDAIIAHEDSHIFKQEAKLAVLIGFLSPIILIGKNVVYSLLDFRAREYHADRFAAEMTSPEQLVGALETLQILKAKERAESDRMRATTPTMMPLLNEGEVSVGDSLIEQYFDYFFGDFAVTEVHPNLGDRIKRIRSEWNVG